MPEPQNRALTAFALNCSLRPANSEQPSSTAAMLDLIFASLKAQGVAADVARVVEHEVRPGVESDMGDGDAWPALRAKIVDADIFILGTPIWMGQLCSVAKRVLERLDAFLSETDAMGRMPSSGKVALVAVVGNEDGAHACHAAAFQALSDVGFTVPGNAGIYWVGEAMGKVNFVDLPEPPGKVRATVEMAVSNAVHLAGVLKAAGYPGVAP